MLAAFPSAVDAVQCAVEVQKALADLNVGVEADRALRFRIGIHVGDVLVRGDDLLGDGVNIAARLEGLAEPGGVCVSGAAYEYVRKALPLTFTDLGPQQVKNLEEPVQAFTVLPQLGTPESQSQPRSEPTKPLPLPDRPSIAVLPFTNASPDPEQAYFAEGVTGDIITELSRFREMAVTARSASFAFRGQPVTPQHIQRELNVKYVLEGSVRKLGSRLRISAQLVDATSGTHVWAERYDEDIERIFDVQDEIVATIVSTLSGRIKSDATERAKRKSPPTWEAFDYFLLGMEALSSPRTKENLLRAAEFFQRAIEIAPIYARAHGRLAASYTLLARETRGDEEARRRALTVAEDWAQKGVSLDRNDASSLLALGFALLYQRRFAEGEHYIDRAVALNPHDDQMALHHVSVLLYLGKAEQAVERAERVLRHNPRWPVALFDLGIARLFTRDHEAAVALLDQVPVHEDRRAVVAAYAHAGRINQAREHAQRYVEELRTSWVGTPTADAGELVTWDLAHNCAYKRPEDIAHISKGLRLAGLPE